MNRDDHASLRDPRFLAALAVLLVNDLVLKAQVPGIVSGKLSDFAGFVIFPVVIGSLLTQLRIRSSPVIVVSLVVVWFVGLQTVPFIDWTQEAVLGSFAPWAVVNTPDITDLLAVPMALVGHAVLAAPHPLQMSRRTLRFIVLAAALGCMADSDSGEAPYVGPPVAGTGENVTLLGSDGSILLSQNGGRSFSTTSEFLTADQIERRLHESPGVRSACLERDPQRCFRLGNSATEVEESTDAGMTWRDSWVSTEDAFLTRSLRSRFADVDDRHRGIAVLSDDTVIVTTVAGPTLRWTPEDGWDPSVSSLRWTYWPLLAAASVFGAASVLTPLMRCRRWIAVVGLTTGLVVATSALLAPAAGLAGLILLPIAFVAGLFFVLWLGFAAYDSRKRDAMERRLRVVSFSLLVAAVLAVLPWVWVFAGRLSIANVALIFVMGGGASATAIAFLIDADSRSTPKVLFSSS